MAVAEASFNTSIDSISCGFKKFNGFVAPPLLELSKGGKQPIELPNGERRTFLEDGDTVIFRGYCESVGHAQSYQRIGLGEVRAMVLPARTA